jgi:hypothetical protein
MAFSPSLDPSGKKQAAGLGVAELRRLRTLEEENQKYKHVGG